MSIFERLLHGWNTPDASGTTNWDRLRLIGATLKDADGFSSGNLAAAQEALNERHETLAQAEFRRNQQTPVQPMPASTAPTMGGYPGAPPYAIDQVGADVAPPLDWRYLQAGYRPRPSSFRYG